MLRKKYGLDATRYYLLRMMSFAQDSMFTPEDFVERFNADLANDLGNLLNRTIGMMNKYFEGSIPEEIRSIDLFNSSNEIDAEFTKFINEQISKVEEEMDSYYVSSAISEIWAIISRANKYIDETMPWVLAKEEDKTRLAQVMLNLVEVLRKIAILIKPFIAATSNKMFEQLGIDKEELKTWESLRNKKVNLDVKVIEKSEP